MIVLDTNVISELMVARPDPAVLAWIQTRNDFRITAITVAGIRFGLARLPGGRRRSTLIETADDVFAGFTDQILAFDDVAAIHFASIMAGRERRGQPIRPLDAQIAAIARAHTAPVATRNTRDFADTGVEVLNPWQPAD